MKQDGRIRFAIVGSGWRAGFYIRIAETMRDKYEVTGVLCRTPEKAASVAQKYSVKAVTDEEIIVKDKPDFIVVAVTKTSIAQVSRYWREKGFTVLCETPVGMTLEDLRAVADCNDSAGRLVVAEQYRYYPHYQSIIDAIFSGKIGEPVSAYVSLAHEYHGISLIRLFLGERYDSSYRMMINKYDLAVTKTGDRYKVYTDGEIITKNKTVINIEFGDGKVCVYDFESEQYHSLIRHNSVKISGTRGEIIGNKLWYLNADNIDVEEILFDDLQAVRTEDCKDLLSQDELAIEAIMDKTYDVSLVYNGYIKDSESVEKIMSWQAENLNCALSDACFMLLMKSENGVWIQSEENDLWV